MRLLPRSKISKPFDMKTTFSWAYESRIMPPELRAVAFDFDRDVEKLWALELPVEEIPVGELEWHLDMPFFWQTDRPFSLKPRDVLVDSEKYEGWMKRIMSVDTRYPIDVILWNGKLQIIDGLHRYCKLYLEGSTTAKVRILPIEWVEKIKPDKG